MNYRHERSRNDKAYFVRTAQKSKKVNFSPKIMRGGIRF